MASCCTPEAFSVAILVASAIAAISGNWMLGVSVPVWDAAAILQAQSQARSACMDRRHLVAGESRLAADVLTRSVKHWHGRSQAALVHEALGRMRARDGDLSAALKEIRKAAHAAEATVRPELFQTEEAKPTPLLDSVRARVRIEEAELMLLAGDYEAAIEAVSVSMAAEYDVPDHRARPASLRIKSMKVLISSAISMKPSAEELAGVRQVFQKTKDSIEGRADSATKAAMYDVAAGLAEAEGDWREAVETLDLAIRHSLDATKVGATLKRAKHRDAGDAAHAAALEQLRLRRSEAIRRRDSGLDGRTPEATHTPTPVRSESAAETGEFASADGEPAADLQQTEHPAIALRQKEHAEYVQAHRDFSDAIDSLDSVIHVMRNPEGSATEALEQRVSIAGISTKEHDLIKYVLASQAARPDGVHSDGVLATLEKMKSKFAGQRSELEKEEATSKEQFDAMMKAAREGDAAKHPHKPEKETVDVEHAPAKKARDTAESMETVAEDAEDASTKTKPSVPLSDGKHSRSSQRRPRNREVSLIASIRSAGQVQGDDDARACVTHCRYGAQHRHSWPDCLEQCIDNPLMRSTFLKMLPDDLHAAKSKDEAMPDGLKLPSEAQLERIQQRR